MYFSTVGVVYGKRHSAWLVLCLLVWLPDFCLSQNEFSVRRVKPPYPLSFGINQVTGSFVNYGPSNSLTTGNLYRPLALSDGKLFIGAKNTLFSVDPGNLTTIAHVSIASTSSINCDNYIRVIEPLSDEVLLECGTNCLQPYCQQRMSKDFSTVGSRGSFGVNEYLVPVLPHQNFSWLLLNETGYQIYSGTYVSVTFPDTLSDPSIARADLTITPSGTTTSIILKNKDDENTVFNAPQFVGDPIDYNGRIYFFFREFALEHINGGRIVYSRVGVVCKNDRGGGAAQFLTTNEIVTFVKARLECSINGTFPYHYNEIQDTYHSTKDIKVVFAIFATRSPGVASSALCAYRLDEIETLFLTGSRYRAMDMDGKLWTKQTSDPVTPRPVTCPDTTASYSDTQYQAIVKSAQLMDQTAVNKLHYETTGTSKSNPLLVSYGERFTQLVVDEDVGLLNDTDVMFIGTENGTVLKAYLTEDRSEGRVVEEIILNTKNKAPVLTMLKSDTDQAVFIGTDIGVYKIPFQHCQDFTSQADCLNAKDPYCQWIVGSGCVYSSAAREEQDLENGVNRTTVVQPSGKIVIHRCPKCKRRILNVPDQPVNLYLLAEAPAGMNLGVFGSEIQCSTPCASLPYNSTKFSSSGSEFLLLYINGSSSVDTTCSCSCVLAIDGGVNATATITLTADNSVRVNLTASEMEVLVKFDNEILAYKDQLQNWLKSVGTACELDNVMVCPANGCPATGCP